MTETAATPKSSTRRRGGSYTPPSRYGQIGLRDLLEQTQRPPFGETQFSLLKIDAEDVQSRGQPIFLAGDVEVLNSRTISIIGARQSSALGERRAYQLGRQLAERGVTVMSGLAAGIDRAALEGAMDHHGRVAAVIGTPLDAAYPSDNKELQEQIYRDHLLVSQFPQGTRVYPSNFPARNRTMAALSDASVIIEASDSSGTLHQAAECQRLGRWLVIAASVLEDKRITWPARFMKYERCHVLRSTDELLGTIYGKH